MKIALAVFSALVLILSLAGCGESKTDPSHTSEGVVDSCGVIQPQAEKWNFRWPVGDAYDARGENGLNLLTVMPQDFTAIIPGTIHLSPDGLSIACNDSHGETVLAHRLVNGPKPFGGKFVPVVTEGQQVLTRQTLGRLSPLPGSVARIELTLTRHGKTKSPDMLSQDLRSFGEMVFVRYCARCHNNTNRESVDIPQYKGQLRLGKPMPRNPGTVVSETALMEVINRGRRKGAGAWENKVVMMDGFKERLTEIEKRELVSFLLRF